MRSYLDPKIGANLRFQGRKERRARRRPIATMNDSIVGRKAMKRFSTLLVYTVLVFGPALIYGQDHASTFNAQSQKSHKGRDSRTTR